MASGAQPAAGSEPRAPGAGAALSPGGAPDANPQRPRLPPPAPRRTPGPRGPRLPRRRANSEPASASAAAALASAAEARAPPRPRAQPCDPRGPLDQRRLLAHLQVALEREARLWRGGSLQRPEVRDAYPAEALWLLGLRRRLRFSSSTFVLALCIFGRLLLAREDAAGRAGQDPPGRASRPDYVPEQRNGVGAGCLFHTPPFQLAAGAAPVLTLQARARALRCAAAACVRLAAKLNEEDESIPCVTDFIKLCGSPYHPSELRRMELSILKDLHWDLHIATPLDFLNIFHALVMLSQPRMMSLLPQTSPSLHVASLTRQLQHCMAGHQLLQFKGSTLALVIITLEFERLEPGCCAPISDLLKKAQVSTEQYSRCKELVLQHLGSLSSPSQADN